MSLLAIEGLRGGYSPTDEPEPTAVWRGRVHPEDLPGMIGRVGTIFGTHGINISSAAVGHTDDGGERLAAMVVTTDAPVPPEVLSEIVASDGFVNGWSVDLS